ncbi:hypothetical protein DICVIV_11523 [Dictyocaulus viviparus]|uniref:Uncharacterized protein n=1 Tax=Dictyocaulus viviparus TaxID=29172 RepID=A0A0D8XD00_DICVI|nr:hypothetical protein DICVIV_11523 [Dictyocaulus viviparus]
MFVVGVILRENVAPVLSCRNRLRQKAGEALGRKQPSDTHFHEKLGNFMAKTLNELLDEEGLSGKCHLQEYYSTSSVLRYEDVNDTVYYTSVYLRPSEGLFSAYIRETSTGFQMASGVSRKNPEIQKEECLRGSPYSGICHCNSST